MKGQKATQTALCLQDPSFDGSQYLLETLLEQSIDCVRAGAAYAWATARGVDLLLEDEVFREFLKQGSFQLIIGVDEITRPEALDRLALAEASHPGLNVRAFLSEPGEGLFHPKLAWFTRAKNGTLVLGSGNLTEAGLWNNREAYTVTDLDAEGMAAIESQWDAWRTCVSSRLHKVTDSEILDRAAKNTWGGKSTKTATAKAASQPVSAPDSRAVLIAEIPRSGDRWAQANFHKAHYEGFFGAEVGTQKRIRLRSVTALGLGEDESRPSVQVPSRNWRFELSAAKGKAYPTAGRPIGVFLRLKKRTFVYSLLLPGDSDYQAVVSYLDSQRPQSDRMRQLQREVSDVASMSVVKNLISASEDAFESEVSN
jgi:HKD family nuclease